MTALQQKVNRILNSWIGVVLFLITLFFIQTPYFFEVMPAVKALSGYVRGVVLILLLFCMVVLDGSIRRMLREELLLFGCMAWGLILCISMQINGKSLKYAIWNIIAYEVIVILLISVFSRVNLRKYLFVFFLYYLIINTVNNACVLFFYNTGMWLGSFQVMQPEYGFFGHINSGVICGLNSLLGGILYSRIYEKKWSIVNGVNLVYSLCTAFIIECVDQLVLYIVVAAVILICWIYDRKPAIQKVLKWVNLKTIMVLNLLVFDAVVVLGNMGWMEMIGIDSGVHGRRELWDSVLTSVFDHPVIGQGFISWFRVLMSTNSYKTFWHQHSFYLQVLYETGLIGAAIFVFIFVICIIQLDKIRRFDLRFILGVLVGVFFLCLVVEITTRVELFLLLSLCYYLPRQLNRQTVTEES